MFDGRLLAGCRDAAFLSSPDVHSIKGQYVVVASRQIAIGGGATGLAAACDPRRIMIGFPVKDATDVHPNGRCRRSGCAQLFRQAASASRTDAEKTASPRVPPAGEDREFIENTGTGTVHVLPWDDRPPEKIPEGKLGEALVALLTDPPDAVRHKAAPDQARRTRPARV
jgi:hypothetical protein